MAYIKSVPNFTSETLPAPVNLSTPNGMTFDVGVSAYFSAGSGYLVEGPTGDIDILVQKEGYLDLDIEATGTVKGLEAIVQASGAMFLDVVATSIEAVNLEANGAEAYVSAYLTSTVDGIGNTKIKVNNSSGSAFVDLVSYSGDIGLIDVKSLAGTTDAGFSAYASGGDIYGFDWTNKGGDAYAFTALSAYSSLGGDGYADGGNIGPITLDNKGGSAEHYLLAVADGLSSGGYYKGGGYIGDITVLNRLGGADANLNVTADALSGGSIGNIIVDNRASSANISVDVSAYGFVSPSGDYQTGGNIGDISIYQRAGASSGQTDVFARAYSGGSIGNITMDIDPGRGGYSADGDIDVAVFGVSGHVATIGNINVTVGGDFGSHNSANVSAMASSGGSIGDITMVAQGEGAGSGQLDLFASAFAYSGAGGSIGNISITNTTFDGDTYVYLAADTTIGNIAMVDTGGGSGSTSLYIAGSAAVGDITFDFADDETGSTNNLTLAMVDGSGGGTVGAITVGGGSQDAEMTIDGDAYAVGFVNLKKFEGSAYIDLDGVDLGTTIRASRGGSFIDGTESADLIYLKGGNDVVEVLNHTEADEVFKFETNGSTSGGDQLFTVGTNYEGVLSANPGSPTQVDDGDIYALVDLAGGDDLTTEAGLLAALNGGEYGNLDAAEGTDATFVTAASGSNVFYVFEAHDTAGGGGDFESAELVAIIHADGTLEDLSQSNFFTI